MLPLTEIDQGVFGGLGVVRYPTWSAATSVMTWGGRTSLEMYWFDSSVGVKIVADFILYYCGSLIASAQKIGMAETPREGQGVLPCSRWHDDTVYVDCSEIVMIKFRFETYHNEKRNNFHEHKFRYIWLHEGFVVKE